jgi:transcriptional regulator with XRE-family HTH domain
VRVFVYADEFCHHYIPATERKAIPNVVAPIPKFITQKRTNITQKKDKNMWLDNLKELKKKAGMSAKQIAEKTRLPERTVSRIFSGDTDNPYVDTLHRIVTILGGSLDDILADTKAVVATESLVEVQESANVIEAQRDLIAVENDMLKDKVAALTAENELLRLKLEHKEEIIAIHNYYNKLK